MNIGSIHHKYSRRKFVISGLAITVLLGIQPYLWRLVGRETASIHTMRTSSEQEGKLRSDIEDVTRFFENQSPSLELLAVSFPKRTSSIALVERLEELAARERVILEIRDIIEKEELDKKSHPSIIPLVITGKATGSVSQIFRFLHDIEHAREFASIETWQLGRILGEPTSEQPISHEMVFNAIFYLQDRT